MKPVVLAASLCLAVLLAGCGGSTKTNGSELKSENDALRQDNERLKGEVRRLEEEVEVLRSDVAEARAEAEQAEATAAEAEAAPSGSEEGSGGGEVADAGPGDVGGEPLPELMPKDFPLPAGASVRNVYEDDSSFSMTILLDSTFDEAVAFYEEQLPAQGWEELVGDRVEGETEGFEGVETSWEKGTFIPEDLPQDDPDYEQTAQTLSLGVYELDPSGVQVDVRWYDYELADRQREAEENDSDGGQSS